MPRVSCSNDYLMEDSWRTLDRFDRYYQRPSAIRKVPNQEPSSTFSANEINEILSRKLYDQLKTKNDFEKELNLKKISEPNNIPLLNSSIPSAPTNTIDSELLALIDRFFNLTYINTIPMVNLLATAVATNFLKENIRELDKKLQEQQQTGALLHCEYDDKDEDDNLSWVSAPT